MFSPTLLWPTLIGADTFALPGRRMRRLYDARVLLPPAIAGADWLGPASAVGSGVGSGARTMIGGAGGGGGGA